MWYASVRFFISLFMNGVPLSLISLLGIPNHVMICSWMKFCYSCSSGFFQKDNLYPFCIILCGCQDPYMAIRKRVYGSYKIKPPSVERPWCCHVLQHIWVSMDCISKYLACMTYLNHLFRVLFHCWPIVPQLQQLPVESSFPWVTFTVTKMYFPNRFSGFSRPQAS